VWTKLWPGLCTNIRRRNPLCALTEGAYQSPTSYRTGQASGQPGAGARGGTARTENVVPSGRGNPPGCGCHRSGSTGPAGQAIRSMLARVSRACRGGCGGTCRSCSFPGFPGAIRRPRARPLELILRGASSHVRVRAPVSKPPFFQRMSRFSRLPQGSRSLPAQPVADRRRPPTPRRPFRPEGTAMSGQAPKRGPDLGDRWFHLSESGSTNSRVVERVPPSSSPSGRLSCRARSPGSWFGGCAWARCRRRPDAR
jgi:hypothetical protein